MNKPSTTGQSSTGKSLPICAPSVSNLIVEQAGSLVNLVFDDGGDFDYDVFVSTAPQTTLAEPFNVESPDGKRDCSTGTTDLGATRTITGYDVEASVGASNLYLILIGTHSGADNGSLGDNSPEGERRASSRCAQ